jgi:leucyl-tRNA synthetase
MLAPFTPHLSEEIWEAMGGEGFVAFAEYPKPDEDQVRKDSEVLETIVQNSMEDVQNITKVTGIKPAKVHFYTADGWKWKMYLRALELAKAGALDVGALIKDAFRDEEMKARAKVVPGFARTVVEDVVKLPAAELEMRVKMGQINEVAVLQDAAAFLEAELGCATAVSGESDPWIEDPAKRAARSKPYRPAIYVE